MDGDEENYVVDWWINYDAKSVEFQVFVNTSGWIGFGLSPTGGMTGADIVIGGVYENGTSYFSVIKNLQRPSLKKFTVKDWLPCFSMVVSKISIYFYMLNAQLWMARFYVM